MLKGNLPITEGSEVFDRSMEIFSYFIDYINTKENINVTLSFKENAISFELDEMDATKTLQLSSTLQQELNTIQAFMTSMSNLVNVKVARIIGNKKDE